MVCGGLRINKHGPVEEIFPDGFVFWKGERFLMDSGFKIYLKQWLSVKSHKMWKLLLFSPVRKKWMNWMSLKIVLRSRKTLFLCGLQGVNNQWAGRHKRVNQKWLTCDLFQKWAEEHVKKRGEYPICCFLLPCTPNVWPRWCFSYYQIVLTFLTITLREAIIKKNKDFEKNFLNRGVGGGSVLFLTLIQKWSKVVQNGPNGPKMSQIT